MKESRTRCVGRTSGYPAIRAGAISPASVQGVITVGKIPTPHNHFTASPNCRVEDSGTGSCCGVGCDPTVSPGIIPPARVQKGAVIASPDDHFTTSPYSGVI